MAGAETSVGEFFVSRSGVCVYVTVRGHAFRVRFETAHAPGVAEGVAQGAEEALQRARLAADARKAELAPLFERAAQDRR